MANEGPNDGVMLTATGDAIAFKLNPAIISVTKTQDPYEGEGRVYKGDPTDNGFRLWFGGVCAYIDKSKLSQIYGSEVWTAGGLRDIRLDVMSTVNNLFLDNKSMDPEKNRRAILDAAIFIGISMISIYPDSYMSVTQHEGGMVLTRGVGTATLPPSRFQHKMLPGTRLTLDIGDGVQHGGMGQSQRTHFFTLAPIEVRRDSLFRAAAATCLKKGNSENKFAAAFANFQAAYRALDAADTQALENSNSPGAPKGSRASKAAAAAAASSSSSFSATAAGGSSTSVRGGGGTYAALPSSSSSSLMEVPDDESHETPRFLRSPTGKAFLALQQMLRAFADLAEQVPVCGRLLDASQEPNPDNGVNLANVWLTR